MIMRFPRPSVSRQTQICQIRNDQLLFIRFQVSPAQCGPKTSDAFLE